MTNINRLYATILLIRCALFPPKDTELKRICQEAVGVTRITTEEYASALSGFSKLLRPDNRLELFFEGALSPAAPFLLYRLKSSGFSGCRATASSGGIFLTATR
ncbi:MAG TPA: hypothetical protein VN652_03485 [Geobacteraceae bacterium]|nr:hypothetical protein [Geobacteraceae bacterium]